MALTCGDRLQSAIGALLRRVMYVCVVWWAWERGQRPKIFKPSE